MSIALLIGFIAALAWGGTWLHGAWASVPKANRDFEFEWVEP